MARRVVPKRLVPLLGSRIAGEKGDIASMYLEDGYLVVTFVDEEKEPLRVPMDFYSKEESDAKYVTFAGDEVITGKKTMHKIVADGYLAIPTSSPSASLNPPSGLTYLYAGSGNYAEIPSGGVANVYPFSIRNGSRYLGEYDVSLQRWDINFASLFSPYALSTDLNSYVNNATYDSDTKKIYLKNGSTNIAEIDATEFIKDGMVSNVTIEDGYLVISFNTDAGQSPIRIAITKIFNPDNYYTKPDIDTLLGSYVNSLEQGAGNYVIGISKDGNKLSVSRGTLPTKLSDFIDDVVAGNYLPIHGTADKALRLSDDTAHTAWGQTFWQNGVPKTISGSLTSVTNITGSGLITMPKAKFSSSLIIPHVAPSGTLESGETYLYSGTGEYAEIPEGGGVADIYDITIRKNGTSLGTYNLGTAAADINIPIGWGDLTENSAHRFLTDTMISTWNAKQNAISDLAAIRSGAALGATALQSETDPVFSASAASGITSNDISAWNAKYDKPSGGIPKSDLATSVQTSLGKADTALQSESDPTVPAWAKKSSLEASDVPTLAISKISGLQDALDGKQPLDADLTAIAALTGSGLLRRNSNNTWSLDTNTYLTSSDHKALTLKVGTITIGSDFNSLAAKTYTITKANITDTIGDTTYAPYNADGYVPTTRKVNGHPLSSDVTVTKGDVGLGNVENTALSTWAGSSYITTLGTITTGTWHGSKIANAYLANSSVTINGKSVSLGGSVSLNLDDIGDGTSKTWDRIVFTDTVQTITGKKTMTNVSVTDYLAVPKIAPASPVTGDIYLWADADGNYSEIPGGGGVADIYDLTLRKNGTSLGTYNLGEQAADVNISIGWNDLTPDSTHRFLTDTQISTWNAKQDAINDLSTIRTQAGEGHTAYGWGNHASAGYASQSSVNTTVATLTPKMQAIPYIEGPTTDTTAGTWTGTYEGITALEEGLTIIYVPHVAGASTTTLNINGLGGKTCYWTGTSKMTTHYPVGTPILLTYYNNGWRRADSNTTYSAGTKALFDAGANTTNRVWSAKVLADSVAPIVHTHTWSDITDGADVLSGYLPISGGELIGNLSMGGNAIINIGSLSAPSDETFSISGVQRISFAIGGAFLPLPGIVKDGNHLVFYTGYADEHDTVGEDLYHLKLAAAEEGSGEDWGGGSYKIYDESNLSLATLAGSSAIGSTSQPVYYNGSALAACNLGTASQKDAVTSISSGGTGLPTAGTIYTFVNNAVTAAQPYKGVSSTAITDGGTEMPTISGYTTRTKGDVVAYNKKEFIWEGDQWRELGDEGSYALKTVQVIAGTGLAGGGAISQDVTLSLSSETIASLGLADSALQSSDLDGYVNAISQGTGNYVTGITKSGKTLTITRATLPTTIALSNVTGADDLKAIEALTGTSGFLKKTAANTWTLDTNTYLTSASHKALTLKVGSITIGSDYNSLAAKTYTITKANLTDTIGTTTYAPYHADGYLPLSGGTLTGTLYTQHILPSSALGGYNIGSETAPFGSGYFSGSLLAEESVETYDVIAHGTADLSVRLAIPTSAPTSPASGKTYLWADEDGNYAETAGGGGSATVYDLTIRKNGTAIGTYNLGTQAADVNIPVGWSDLTPDASHRFLTDSLISTWNAKQDAISDLATIRSNASTAATAVDIEQGSCLTLVDGHLAVDWQELDSEMGFGSAAYKNYVTSVASGNNNLVTSGAVYTAVNAKYTKPSGGIPKTDLASAVQTTLTNADTAYGWGNHASAGYLTSFTETDPTVPSWAKASTKPTYTLDEVADGNTRKLSDYLPLNAGSGKALTGDLYLDASSTQKYVKAHFAASTNIPLIRASAAQSGNKNGRLYFGDGHSFETYLLGGLKLYLGTSDASDASKLIVMDSSGNFYPYTNNTQILGLVNNKWKALYATTLYGNLDWSYITGKPNTISGYGITDAVQKGEYYMPTNGFADSFKGIQINSINNGFYALNARSNITITMTGLTPNSPQYLFNGDYEAALQIAAGETGVILIECSSVFTTYPYGYLYVSFYDKYAPSSVSVRAYGTRGGVKGWYNYDAATDFINTSGHCFRAYNGNIYYIEKWEITIVAKEEQACRVTEIEHQWTRGTQAMMSAVTKFAIKQDLYGEVEAPKFTVRGGTSSQFLKADGSLDSNTYALSSALGSYLPLSADSGKALTGDLYLNASSAARAIYATTANGNRRLLYAASAGNSISVGTESNDYTYINSGGGVYLQATASGATHQVYLSTGGLFAPGVTNSITLGASSRRWKNLYTSAADIAGNTSITGNLVFDASAADRNIYYKASDNANYRALLMSTNGSLTVGYDNPAKSKNTNVDGYDINLRFGSTKQYNLALHNTNFIGTNVGLIRPNADNATALGHTSYRWSALNTVSADITDKLAVPTTAPTSPSSSKTYLWVDDDGNYSEMPLAKFNQLVQNGNFSTNSNWVRAYGGQSFAIANNTLTITCTAAINAPMVYQAVDIANGHKVFYSYYIKVNTAENLTDLRPLMLYPGSQYPDENITSASLANWTRITGVATATSAKTRIYLGTYNRYSTSKFAIGDTIQLRNVWFTDLTEAYGAGNEPTAEQFQAAYPADNYDYQPIGS